MTARQEGVTEQRFRITWDVRDSCYRVSIPHYNGGEVVRAEAVDALTAEVARLKSALQDFAISFDAMGVPGLAEKARLAALGGGA